jgi:hypothetical protein
MAKVKVPSIVAAVGEWGPFDDGRTIGYADIIDATGGGTFRATLAEGATPPDLYEQGDAELEFYVNSSNKLKVRLHSFAARNQKAAA